MKNLILTTLLLTSTATMAADFNYPTPPVRPYSFEAPKTFNNYITAFGGSNLNKDGYVLGGNIGRKIYGPVNGELNYIFHDPLNKTANHRVIGNLVYNVPIFYGTVYGIAGAGYNIGDYKTPLWNVGGGYNMPLTEKFSIDTRYLYTSRFDNRKVNDQTITSGIRYRF